ncbi:hypothetical protein ACJ41O_005781 [Fusarium nematophilum]
MRWSYGILILLIFTLLTFTLTIHFLGAKTNSIGRYPGDANNDMVREKTAFCNASEPSKWVYDECSLLIGCVLNRLDEIYKNDLAIGTTIIGLLPSIIGIAAAPPEEIIKLALVSPPRGVATAAFSVGVSPTVFTRLKPMGSGPSSETERTWIIPLARVAQRWSVAHVLVKVVADIIIMALTGVMLWQNWTVKSAVLVQWLCESPFMVFTWPLVSMLWVSVALSLLYAMTESVCFKHATQDVEYG